MHRLHVAQTWASYRTAASTTPDWPGCIGAVRQPLGSGPAAARQARNMVQRAVMQSCARVARRGDGHAGTPALFFQEALHGAEGDTIFPTPAALGASWDLVLLRRVMAAVSAGVRVLGSHAVLAPVLDLFVDGRFGRMQEGFGEDPMHVAACARAAVGGLQGDVADISRDDGGSGSSSDSGGSGSGGGGGNALQGASSVKNSTLWRPLGPRRVFAVAKHFVAYGALHAGLNGAAASVDRRALLEDHLRPWRAFVDSGGTSAMAGHHVALGVPMHAHGTLLTGVLRRDLGLPGPIWSDCNDVGGLVGFGVVANRSAAAAAAMRAGIDVDLQCGRHCPRPDSGEREHGAPPTASSLDTDECGAFAALHAALADGLLAPSDVEAAAERLKAMKVAAGLDHTPLEPGTADASAAALTLDAPRTRELSQLAAERGAVLLRNERHMLPLLQPDLPSRAGHGHSHGAGDGSDGGSGGGDGGGAGADASAEARTERAGRPWKIAVIGPLGGCERPGGSRVGTGRKDKSGVLTGTGSPPGALCAAQRALLGSYASALSIRRVQVPTIVDGLRETLSRRGSRASVAYAAGVPAEAIDGTVKATGGGGGSGGEPPTARGHISTARAEAVALARRSDIVIATLGDTARTAGEWADRASFELPGGQHELLTALCATGTRLALVVVGGRPVTFGGPRGDALLANISALLFSFPPGQEGGRALARLLVGDVTPTGRLAHAWPRRAGPSPWLQPIATKWTAHSWASSGMPHALHHEARRCAAHTGHPTIPTVR